MVNLMLLMDATNLQSRGLATFSPTSGENAEAITKIGSLLKPGFGFWTDGIVSKQNGKWVSLNQLILFFQKYLMHDTSQIFFFKGYPWLYGLSLVMIQSLLIQVHNELIFFLF